MWVEEEIIFDLAQQCQDMERYLMHNLLPEVP